MNNRLKKLIYSTASSVLYQTVAIVYGLILPRVFISAFGSEANGLVSSITQFLSFISLAECGVGAVVTSAFYKPIAEKDNVSLSKIFISADSFFKKIGYLLIGYTLVLSIIYPMLVKSSFSFLYISVLIIVMAISSFAQYYFGMTYRLLLCADQLVFVQFLSQILCLVLNLVASVALIKLGASLHFVKLITSSIYLLQPIIFASIAKRRYVINKKIEYDEEPIKQKWNGIAQHIASVVVNNTDTVILSVFSTLTNVSIYSVYNMVVAGIR